MLPPLFRMDDYSSCLENKNSFCKSQAYLHTTDTDSQIWRTIQDLHKNRALMDRSVLHRGFCIPRLEATDLGLVKKISEISVNREINHLNLTSEVEVIGCFDGEFSMTLYDKTVITIVLGYLGLILVATLYSWIVQSKNRYISVFSLQHNWRKRIAPIENEDYKKLRSMQGIRFFSLTLILWVHTKLSYGMVYIENPSFLEEIIGHRIVDLINLPDVFYVKTYFMISSWLLTIQILRIAKDHGSFSLKQVGIIILNRYFRIAVSLAVLIALINTSLPKILSGPIDMEMIIPHARACRNNWWATMLFVNNFHYVIDMCNPITWYLSADFQMYIFNTVIFYIVIKYKWNAFKTFAIFMSLATVLYGTMIYVYDVDIIFRPTLRNIEYRILSTSKSFFINYQSTISIFGCSSVGVLLGLVYSENKNTIIQNNAITTLFWIASSAGLPLLALLISIHEYSGLAAAILGPLVKPLFVLGIGIGILGMSHGLGGVVKRICELRFAEIMGNFNYCIYICHLLVCFNRTSAVLFPLELSYAKFLQDLIRTIFVSIAVGVFVTLTVEEPGISIQKKFLPQIKKSGGLKEEVKKEN